MRNANISEVSLLLTFIKELAVEEGFPFDVVVTEESLKENLFGEQPIAEAIFFFVDGAPAGFAVYYHTFSTTTGKKGLHLDDLYVRPQFQGGGIGKKALGYLASLAKGRNCGRFEWWALKWNENAIGFYESIGARHMEELSIFRLEEGDIQNLAEYSPL
ncbi:GNAT family N-acetyltransferase [Marinomonas sp. C1424]|uniref:GNAT family N-acetyltransferase n=1 Tax=Marinomonas transparens TaxID=2795388 RepID=A0A934JSZ4_9GAMM|nr:GNAT family N-acetyltransferase [Marinomonas transparens]